MLVTKPPPYVRDARSNRLAVGDRFWWFDYDALLFESDLVGDIVVVDGSSVVIETATRQRHDPRLCYAVEDPARAEFAQYLQAKADGVAREAARLRVALERLHAGSYTGHMIVPDQAVS